MAENTKNNPKAETSAAEILHQRAMLLARRLEAGVDEEQFLDAVLFQLAGETYAIALEFLQDVLPMTDITPVPCTPSFVAGIINVRGQILSVLDLKVLFELTSASRETGRNVLLLSNGEMTFGVTVDRMYGVNPLPLSAMQASPATLTGFRGDYVQGVTADTTIVLDAGKMLADERLIVHETVS